MRCVSVVVKGMGTVMTKCFGGTSWFLLIQKASRSSFMSYHSVLLWGIMARWWRKDALGCQFLNVSGIGGIGGIVLLNRLMKHRHELIRQFCRSEVTV